MVTLGQHLGDLDGHGDQAWWQWTPLSVVNPYKMGVTPRKALDMYGSPYLTISYLLRSKQGDLEDKSQAWIGDKRG